MAYLNGKKIDFPAIINISSDAPNTPTRVILSTPVVSISTTGRASWTAVTYATSYVYEICEGSIIVKTDFTSLTYVSLTDGQSISVQAIGDNEIYLNSEWSTKKTYTAPVIPATRALYYGVGTVADEAITSTFITGLTSKEQTTRVCSFTVSPAKQYVYFSAPKHYCIDGAGTEIIRFTQSGLTAVFRKVWEGKIGDIDYCVYRTKNLLTCTITFDVN